jgi:hypothetical protein
MSEQSSSKRPQRRGQAALGLIAAKKRFCGADTRWRSIAKVRERFDRDGV